MVIESCDLLYKKAQQVTSSVSTKTLMYTSQNNLDPEQVRVMAVTNLICQLNVLNSRSFNQMMLIAHAHLVKELPDKQLLINHELESRFTVNL